MLPARRAVDLNPGFSKARFVLGLALASQNRPQLIEEAVFHLEKAAIEIPDARLAIARIHEAKGEVGEAREELEEYLSIADADEREKVESWLARLE